MIGNQLAAGTALTIANDSFNGNGSTTAFTLSQTVSGTTDIEVLVDNVQQSPYDSSYSVSGTTLTFSAAPASGTNNIYVIYNASKHISTNQVVPDDGSVTHSKFHTTALNPITLDQSNNRVGIGTTSPDGTLHVKGSSDHGRFILESGGTSGSTNTTFMQFHNHGGTEIAQIQIDEGASNEGQMIFKTGGTTTNMTITKDGCVLTPNQPLAVTYYTASTQHGAYGAGSNRNATECKPGGYRQDIGSLYSSSTGRYTITQPGVYRAGFNGSNYNNGISNYYYIFIRLNGTIYSYTYQNRDSGITWAHLSGETYLTCAAGDYIDFYQNHDSSGTDKGGFDINQYTTFYVELVR